MYYSGAVWPDSPSVTVNHPNFIVDVPWDGSYLWRADGVWATTQNGDAWFVAINPAAADPDLAGGAIHTYDSTILNCYSYHGTDVYTLDDGTPCTTAYVCNHQDWPRPGNGIQPTPTTSSSSTSATSSSPTASFAHNNEGNPVTLVGKHSPSDIFSLVRFNEGENDAKYCQGLSQPATIPGSGKTGNPDCTIAFDCGPFNADMMFSVAKQILDSDSKAWDTSTEDLPACPLSAACLAPNTCSYMCEQHPDCSCDDNKRSRDITSIASGKVVVDMLGGPEAAQSRLTYQITCPSAESPNNCGLCKALDIGSVVLDLLDFGIGSAVGEVVCSVGGC